MTDYMRRVIVHLSDVVACRGYLGDHAKGTLILSIDDTLLMGRRHCDCRLNPRRTAVLLQHVLMVAVVTLEVSTSALSST